MRTYIESLGSVEIEAAKTQVSFKRKNRFAWVWLPQTWTKKRPPESVTLTFSLPRQIKDERIAEAVEPRPRRWTHQIVLEKKSDLDEKVKSWLQEAYEQER
ncbi:MAG: hypothetical protein JW778_00245 [Candidatus Altiarchaeota archaeon]|nr:hypothetical protein [Candidatus Altiarchaeota archaeon]